METNVEVVGEPYDLAIEVGSEEFRKYGDEPLPEKTPPSRPSAVGRPLQPSSGSSNTDVSMSEAESSMAEVVGDDKYKEALPKDLIGAIRSPSIEDNSPAAEALRANANVHVRRVDKLARRVQMQSLRKFVKRATLRGNKRGKPPRIPTPHRSGSGGIYVVEEGVESGDEEEKTEDVDPVLEAKSSVKSVDPANDEVSEKERDLSIVKSDEGGDVPKEVLHGTLEAGRKLLAATDPHEILHTQRWRLRRRQRKEGRKSYVKGKVIDGEHELYALSIAVMLGVRTSIGSTNTGLKPKEKRWLSSDDFMASEKYEFRPSGSSKTPPHQLGHTFKFKDYSPVAFAFLRRMFGINEFDFLLSVCGNANFIEFISNAKSGQFFFYSRDGKFMIKTMTNAESKFLRRILPHYFRHCCQNPNTIITKFLGMYRVKLYHLRRNVKFVIMNSVYYTDKVLNLFYDLKGSVTGRDAKPHHEVKKDNDLRRLLPTGALALSPELRSRVRRQIVADCDFMRRMKIMDYSLLVGVHNIPAKRRDKQNERSQSKRGFRFSDRRDNIKLSDHVRNSLSSEEGSNHSLRNTNAGRTKESILAGLVEKQLSTANVFQTDVVREGSHKLVVGHKDDEGKDDIERQFSLLHEYGVDDDDDNSYLEGTDKYVSSRPQMRDIELEAKKEETIEQVYWPFHQFYDIHGYRRARESLPVEKEDGAGLDRPSDAIVGLNIPSFVPPLSDRKDGGLEMDTAGLTLPVQMKGSQNTDQLCSGRVFYLGVIDILQQYNIRKRVEARYRRVRGSGWQDASCVHPNLYAERFIRFFDEYSQRIVDGEVRLQDGEEAVVFDGSSPASQEDLFGADDGVDDEADDEDDTSSSDEHVGPSN